MVKYPLYTLLFCALTAQAEQVDTLRNVDLDEVNVVATIKENGQMRQQPSSSTLIGKQQMESTHSTSLKAVSNLVPNFFVPDYGSRLTSAVYLRGIGSRLNTPSVGLYVDNIPYVDKSAFDFNYYDIERVDVLRGPQGTLYGRNTMGGLVRVYTKNPFHYTGTDVKAGYATGDNHRSVSLAHYHRISDKFAFSASGYYEGGDGFFENDMTGKKVDGMQAGGGKLRGIFKPNEKLSFDLSVNYDYSDEGAYPYYYMGAVSGEELYSEYVGKICNNRENRYRRGMLNAGFNVQYKTYKWQMNAITGYQNLNDRMFIDQDFIYPDIYSLEQKQKINTITEEVTFKNITNGKWEWLTGLNFMYQTLKTEGPVTFYGDGLRWLENNINSQMPSQPAMSLSFVGDEMKMGGTFQTPTISTAVFHQSTFHFTEAFSATIGLRLEYEHNSIDYNAPATFCYAFAMPQMKVNLSDLQSSISEYEGTIKKDYFKVLPKLSLKYEFNKRNNIYASVSKGVRSGGYNVQMFSDILQGAMQTKMMEGVKDAVFAYLDKNMPQMADRLKPTISNAMPQSEMPTVDGVAYKPEFSWNYELGTHLTTSNGQLQADASVFYIHTRDQQVARFAESGLGRMMVNAGKSESYGGELSVRYTPNEHLAFVGNYGYTHAKFKNYDTSVRDAEGNILKGADYSGNYVPFVPMHTMNVDAQYTWFIGNNSLSVGANCYGAGKMYWLEDNNAQQSFYAQLGARVAFETKLVTLMVWGKNLTGNKYNTFYFESGNRKYEQHCKPLQVGVDLSFHF